MYAEPYIGILDPESASGWALNLQAQAIASFLVVLINMHHVHGIVSSSLPLLRSPIVPCIRMVSIIGPPGNPGTY